SQRSVHSASLTDSRTDLARVAASTILFMVSLVQSAVDAATIPANERRRAPHPHCCVRTRSRAAKRRYGARRMAVVRPHFPRARPRDAALLPAAAHGLHGGGHLRPPRDRRHVLRQ